MMQRPAGWNRGTTSTELLLAICLVGVLLFFAIPRYISQSKQGQKTLRDTVVISVRAGLARFDPPPEDLDGLPAGTVCSVKSSCFQRVIPEGIVLEEWQKLGPRKYLFQRGSEQDVFFYNPETKEFSQQ